MGDLHGFKAAIKGRKIQVWVLVFGEDGEYIEVSHAKFLYAIAADIPFNRDGLSDGTAIDYKVDGDTVFVG